MSTASRFTLRRKYLVASLAVATLAAGVVAYAGDGFHDRDVHFWPGNLVVSRSVYDNKASNVQVGEVLPPNCPAASGACGAASGATNDGTYPYVWNNVIYDPSFGITSRIYLDQITPNGWLINSLEVPNSLLPAAREGALVTSFSSKSELGLHLSLDGRYLTFMGYVAPVNAVDVSNSNTPLAQDSTNPVGETFERAVAQVDGNGHFHFTETNAYSGNNGRAAIYNNLNGANVFYTVGNAGNGSNPQPDGIILGAGAQYIVPSTLPEALQNPTTPAPLASFSVTALGAKADKIGKDDNFRGITVFNKVVYLTKGSGSNGVNTVYFIDTTGRACPNGVGVPGAGAALPTDPLSYNASTLQTTGLPSNMCVLAGFPSTPNKSAKTLAYPFALWFADANTLYVADEGDGYTGGTDLYTHAAAQTTAGLQKWVFNATTQSWTLAYTLQAGLNLGQPYTVKGYPTGTNAATSLPWSPAADGLRQLTGRVDGDGKVTIWATTSTISGNGDTGADPNKLVAIRDELSNASAASAADERFVTLRSASFGEVLRGVSFTPDTDNRSWH
ncbi:hypothetical protein [Dyella monticola]|uniref:hypothetical protein n=1 Tax=Dyella monticola TaxID=1927958 RepID=UPI001E616008|nr:hypothetical protein [Dyella monticola]